MGGGHDRKVRPRVTAATRTRRPAAAPVVAGTTISHPDRLIYPDLGVTKLAVARYYDEVAEAMVPHVAGRPLTLLRCGEAIDPTAPKGGCQMIRHGKAWGPRTLRRVRIEELRKTGEYLVADNREALVGLAQMGVIEVHTWNAAAEAPYRHDRLVVDLDPGPDVSWADVVAAARLARDALATLNLRSWLKTTGGRGLHVVAPIRPTDAATCLEFARGFAAALVAHDPALFTTAAAKAGRAGQILVDTLRNNRTNTIVAAYSLRARPGAPVSVPLAWDELTPRRTPARFTIATVPRRLREISDPWAEYGTTAQSLIPTAKLTGARSASP
jgi:bifunctional non-homologous end joining protein LigD